jgi:uncharacterized protein YaeQ
MALNATIFKATVQIADMDRGYYREHALTIARHPSETDERMMVRLLAFALHASEALSFGKGLSTDDEPDIWQKDLTGAIEVWIDVGQPDEKRIRKACGRADQVFVYSYGVQGARVWWDQIGARLEKIRNLTVIRLPTATRELSKVANRNMRLSCNIQDRHVLLGDDQANIGIELDTVKTPTVSMR